MKVGGAVWVEALPDGRVLLAIAERHVTAEQPVPELLAGVSLSLGQIAGLRALLTEAQSRATLRALHPRAPTH